MAAAPFTLYFTMDASGEPFAPGVPQDSLTFPDPSVLSALPFTEP